MNPITQVAQVSGDANTFFSCWTGAEILAGLIYRRRIDLRLEYQAKSHSTDTSTAPIYVPNDEMQYLATDAFNGATFFAKAYLSLNQPSGEETAKTGYQRRVG